MNVSYCGIDCESCKLYKATISNNDELRKEVAHKWGDLYERIISISEMNCLGCKSETVFEACTRCDIKACNQKRGIENCSNCTERLTCDRIKIFIDWQKYNNTEVKMIT